MQALHEPDRRAFGWTPGPALHLADGSVWYLPRFDLPLLATSRDLAQDIRRVLWFASELANTEYESGDDNLALANFDHIWDVTSRLLQRNYDLSSDEWAEVFPEYRGDWFAEVVCKLGDAIVLAIFEDWRPLASSFLMVEPEAVLSN